MKKSFSLAAVAVVSCIIAAAPLSAQSALNYYNQGLSYQDREDWYGASESFHEALQANPVYGDAWFHLAQVTYELDDFNLVLSYLDQADKYAKGRTDILNLRGNTYIALGRLADARTAFETVLKKEPNNVDARFGLAELDLYSGRIDGAQQLYQDALVRDGSNRKALLSLALLAAESGKNDKAQAYLEQALRFHSGEAQVHYLAAYLDAKQGDYAEAERRARAAVQIKNDYTRAYSLLASILYAEQRYADVIDICDYLIAQKRNTPSAWYLKGLSQYRKNDSESAIATWSTGLEIDPQDEIMRAALELLVTRTLPVEDARRAGWAQFHVLKAHDFAKRYMAAEARYEYQRALRLNPQNVTARAAFAEMLSNEGLNEQYLDQLKFVQNEKGKIEKPTHEDTRISDTIEAYDSLMKTSLATKWSVNPFYLDKTRYQIGIYSIRSHLQLVHPEAENVAAQLSADIFSGVSAASVTVVQEPVSGYGEAFRLARANGLDYFIVMNVQETEREISLSADMYSARTGTVTTHISSFRTGNDRLASAARSFRTAVLGVLPVRGKVIARDGNDLLVDLGRTEGIAKGAELAVVHEGSVRTADTGPGIVWDESAVLGKVTIGAVGEEISSGVLVQNGFYDRVNIGDEVVVTSIPKTETVPPAPGAGANAQPTTVTKQVPVSIREDGKVIESQPSVTADTTPQAAANGKRVLKKKSESKAEPKVPANEIGLTKTPAVIDMIRSIY